MATWAQKQDISNHKSGTLALISRPHFLLESEDESNKIMKSQKKKKSFTLSRGVQDLETTFGPFGPRRHQAMV